MTYDLPLGTETCSPESGEDRVEETSCSQHCSSWDAVGEELVKLRPVEGQLGVNVQVRGGDSHADRLSCAGDSGEYLLSGPKSYL